MLAAVYLDAEAAAVELQRGRALAAAMLAAREAETRAAEPAAGLPNALRDPRAHRARECLHYLHGHPGASNRQVARAVGIARDDQISRLLARLAGMELLDKRPARPGGPNAWSLSLHGRRVVPLLPAKSGERA